MVKHAEDLRRTILDASLDLIANDGLGGFSMREVARRAGVSHQAPYHYFADREAILAAIVGEGFESLRAAMAQAVDSVEEPVARLTAIGQAYVKFALEHPAHFKLMFRSELVRVENHDEAHACAHAALDLLVSVVSEVTKGEFGDDEYGLVLACWSLAHGLATLTLEGKLDDHCGEHAEDQSQVVQGVFKAFDKLLRSAAR